MQEWTGSSVRHSTALAVAAMLCATGPAAAKDNTYECLIEPIQVVELRSPVEGLIEKVNVRRGDPIKAGQVLVTLQSDVERTTVELARYRAGMSGTVAAARDRLEYARRKLERQRKLHNEHFVTAQVRDEAETEMLLAESELRAAIEGQELAKREFQRAVALLDQRALRSPFNGVVMDRMLNPGDLAESGTGRKPILLLAQVDPLRVDVVLPSEAYGQLKVGMRGQVAPDGFAGQYPATVTVVDPVLDAASSTFRVRLELSGKADAPPGGVRCQVTFDGAHAEETGQAVQVSQAHRD